jgi:hypothetical protein
MNRRSFLGIAAGAIATATIAGDTPFDGRPMEYYRFVHVPNSAGAWIRHTSGERFDLIRVKCASTDDWTFARYAA